MSAKQIRVLIVDDSEICCETAKLMLEEEGLEVFTLSTPIGFSANLQNLRPDIALVDVAMPAMRGNQLVDIANRRGAASVCPVILFSDRKRSELDLLAKSCGATGVICKSDDWHGIIQWYAGIWRFDNQRWHSGLFQPIGQRPDDRIGCQRCGYSELRYGTR